MRTLHDLLARFSRPLRIAIQVSILAVIVIAVGAVGFIEYSAQPSFCLNCHVMEPYYESWATSSHNDVACIECHYAPGVKAEAMGKIQAANQVVKYVTGAYGMKPWAEIEDASCLRSGCHSERKLESEVDYRGIRFDHAEHLGELRRGKQLRCTACHSQIVQGDHVAVTADTCILCHFKDRPPGEPVAGCTGCHLDPPRLVSDAGFVVDHPRYVDELTSCIGCHEEVTSGSGGASQARCFTCHNEPERIDQYENIDLVHRVHLADHNIECAQCHTPIEHRVTSLASTFQLDCASCHQDVHDLQRRMYAGTGGHATESMPSFMFLARVSCRGCHGLPSETEGHDQVQRAGEAACLSCHGIRYANILPSWQQEMEQRVRRVEAVVAGAQGRAGSAPVRTRATVDSLIGLASENVEFVSVGKGAHNITYADELLAAAVDLVREAIETGGLPYSVDDVDLGTRVRKNICLRCHLGAEDLQVEFQGARFDHRPHVTTAGLQCADCHTSLDEHGGTTIDSRETCDTCHHSQIRPMNCARCHSGPGGAPSSVIAHPTGNFSHDVHRGAGLACATCHTPPAMGARGLDCATCHERHHRPEVTCVGCHQQGTIEKHTPAMHGQCAVCHGAKIAGITEWSRKVCTVCHTDRIKHNAPVECTQCHQIPAMAGAPEGTS